MAIQAIQAGLSLEEFGKLTPHEFQLHRLAHVATTQEEWHRAAFISANVMNCWTGKGQSISPLKLLGWKDGKISAPQMDNYDSAEEFAKALEEFGSNQDG